MNWTQQRSTAISEFSVNLFGPANICIEHEFHRDFDKEKEFRLPLLNYPNTNFIDNILKSFFFVSLIKFPRVG